MKLLIQTVRENIEIDIDQAELRQLELSLKNGNGFVDLKDKTYINPKHIVSYKIIGQSAQISGQGKENASITTLSKDELEKLQLKNQPDIPKFKEAAERNQQLIKDQKLG